MIPRVYVETSVISYLTARDSRDVVMAGHQQTTRAWWAHNAIRFEAVASQLVVTEASAGDATAASERLAQLASIPLLPIDDAARDLARQLLAVGAVPQAAAEDALHIGIAVTNGVQFLVTWNFRHLANAVTRSRIETACRAAGYEPAVICTPEELLEVEP